MFSQLGLCEPIVRAVSEKGYDSPSPIQEQSIPAILSGQDVLAAAQTGTGKTAGFVLPILERLQASKPTQSNQVKALVLAPTRELAAQVEENVKAYSRYLNTKSQVVYGGVSINPQMRNLRSGVDILVATPGRLLDLHSKNAVKFDQLEMLVLDEADRMLDMGFIHDIKRVLKLLPKQRQTLLFSATFDPEITELAESMTQDPVKLSTAPANTTVKKIEQHLLELDRAKKTTALITMIKQKGWSQTLVFTRTKRGANRLAQKLENAKIPSAAIHGNKGQGARTKALAEFKDGSIKVLVATDIAARGIDISELPIVVNFELPNTAADYVHRIGRTGRAGASGQAWSFITADDVDQLQEIEQLIQELLPREQLVGFEPQSPVPATRLLPPKKPKKPKKPKAPKSATQQQEGTKPKVKSADEAAKPASRRRRRPNPSGQKRSSGDSRGQQQNRGRQSSRRSHAGNKPASQGQ